MDLAKRENLSVEPPKQSSGDAAHAIVKGVLSSVPILGGPVAELFSLVIAPPLEKRKEKWMHNVVASLQELNDKKGISLDDLKDNEQFHTTLIQATHAAMRHHQQEKLDALRNAILNSALLNAPEDSLQQMFLKLVDSLTVWHLKLVMFAADPPKFLEERRKPFPEATIGAALSTPLELAFPELSGKREFYDQLWKELHADGLVGIAGVHTMMTGQGLRAKRTTPFGDQFLRFVSNPL